MFDEVKDYVSEAGPRFAWSPGPPTVPGDYLYAYRFASGDRWTQGRMSITAKMIGEGFVDSSETLWLGPIPEPTEPATETGNE